VHNHCPNIPLDFPLIASIASDTGPLLSPRQRLGLFQACVSTSARMVPVRTPKEANMKESQKKNAVLNDKFLPIDKSGKEKKKNKGNQSKVLKQRADAAQTSGKSKQAILIALLQRPAGATIDEMATAVS